MPFGATPNSKQRPIIPLHAQADDKRRKRFARQQPIRERVREILLARRTRRYFLGLAVLFVLFRLYVHVYADSSSDSLPAASKTSKLAAPPQTTTKVQGGLEVKRGEKAPIPANADDEATTTTQDVQALVDAANAAIRSAEAEEEAKKIVLPPAPPEADLPSRGDEPSWKRRWALEGAPGTDSNALVAAVRSLVASTPVVVFSKTTCPYSSSAKTILSGLKMYPEPFIIEVDQRSDTATVKNALTDLTHHSTFPNIFIGGKHVGGADDLHRLALDSKLVPMLIKAGVTFRKP